MNLTQKLAFPIALKFMGLNQKEFAAQACVSEQNLSDVLRGRRRSARIESAIQSFVNSVVEITIKPKTGVLKSNWIVANEKKLTEQGALLDTSPKLIRTGRENFIERTSEKNT